MKIKEYSNSRLTFRKEIIDFMNDDDVLAIHTRHGTYRMTKADFQRVFPNVKKSPSYQDHGYYNYATPPKKAGQFLINELAYHTPKAKEQKKQTDPVGNEIREKIREIGELWRNSEHNPNIKEETLKKWDGLIEEWINDTSMPLIVRKDTGKKGQLFKHRSGREIIVADNSTAIWAIGRALSDETLTLKQIKNMLRHDELPVVFMSTKAIKEKAKYTKSLGQYSLKGWKVCHIEPIGFNNNKSIEDIEITEIENHFRRYINPRNMFILPKEIGDLGEIQVFINEQKKPKDRPTS